MLLPELYYDSLAMPKFIIHLFQVIIPNYVWEHMYVLLWTERQGKWQIYNNLNTKLWIHLIHYGSQTKTKAKVLIY